MFVIFQAVCEKRAAAKRHSLVLLGPQSSDWDTMTMMYLILHFIPPYLQMLSNSINSFWDIIQSSWKIVHIQQSCGVWSKHICHVPHIWTEDVGGKKTKSPFYSELKLVQEKWGKKKYFNF